jgi:hypothetical protein
MSQLMQGAAQGQRSVAAAVRWMWAGAVREEGQKGLPGLVALLQVLQRTGDNMGPADKGSQHVEWGRENG